MRYQDELEACREFARIGRNIRETVKSLKERNPIDTQLQGCKEYAQIETWQFVGALASLADSILSNEHALQHPIDVDSTFNGIIREWEI